MQSVIPIAERLKLIKPSPTLAVNAKAKALKAAGADILNFSVGEPDFDTPEHVREAGKAAIDTGFTRYTAVPGIPELREAIAGRLAADHGWHYTPEQIQVSCGGKHGLYNMAQVLFNPGDEVLIPPTVSLPMVQLAGAAGCCLWRKKTTSISVRISVAMPPPHPRIVINSPPTPPAPCSARH
jgi:aspartate aminotransferase